jgi:hypothetical protein
MSGPQHVLTLLLLGIFFFVTLPMHAGFVARMLFPFFVVRWLYDAVMMVRHPEQRARRGAGIAIWATAFAAVVALNLYWYRESRTYADGVPESVLAHEAKTGSYPTGLEQLGIRSDDPLLRKWRLVYGHDQGDKPSLSYAVPFAIFDFYHYDFQTHRWQYLAD